MLLDKIINPEFKGTIDNFLRSLGCDITPSIQGEESNACIRIINNSIFYGFKIRTDFDKFCTLLSQHHIPYNIGSNIDIDYPFRLSISKDSWKVQHKIAKTIYNRKTTQDAIDCIRRAKDITVKAQDYGTSAILLDMQKYLQEELDKHPTLAEPTPITKDDVEHLTWMYARLMTVHGENPNYDYMSRMKQILIKLESNL